jgi:putative two-component system response regulator
VAYFTNGRRQDLEAKILIADDEEMIRNTLARRLAREGYSCVTARNGREALDHFCKDDFLLIISDLRMPEMGGMELLKTVKALNPKMTVIILTGYAEIDVAVDAMRLGTNDFIMKPVNLDLVILSVRNALEKKRLEDELEAYHRNLERLVEEKTGKLQQAYLTLKKAHLDSIKILIEAIDAKDPYTLGHSDRVRRMSLEIAKLLGFTEERMENLEYGALLHDIGKIGIKDGVLQKGGPLSSDEYHYIQEHPLIGAKIVEGIQFFNGKIPMIRHHHEHFDGTGYPDGLAGEAIPLEARIIAVPDAFDAMFSLRPHRKAMAIEDVLSELKQCENKQFDPLIVDIFLHNSIYKSTDLTREQCPQTSQPGTDDLQSLERRIDFQSLELPTKSAFVEDL